MYLDLKALKLQRGDVVKVSWDDGVSYEGVVFSSNKHYVRVLDLSSGYTYDDGTKVDIKLVERRGLMNFRRLFNLVKELFK